MKAIVKWSDVKRAGVTRGAWRAVKSRLHPVEGCPKTWRATEVCAALGLPPETFEQPKGYAHGFFSR
jgi:hypothetical protein